MLVVALAAALLAIHFNDSDPVSEVDVRTSVTFAPTDAPGFEAITTTSTPTASVPAADPPVTTPTSALPSVAVLDLLSVAPEASPTRYDRDLFEHRTDADHDSCDTRCEVLEAERRSDIPGLGLGWYSIYDGYTTTDSSQLDVDHVVALAEAWRSGAHAWDNTRRQAFANDLDEPGALIAVTSISNRSKSDKDPAAWQPRNREAWCEWGLGWVQTKIKWSLTADQAEVDALRNVLAGC